MLCIISARPNVFCRARARCTARRSLRQHPWLLVGARITFSIFLSWATLGRSPHVLRRPSVACKYRPYVRRVEEIHALLSLSLSLSLIL